MTPRVYSNALEGLSFGQGFRTAKRREDTRTATQRIVEVPRQRAIICLCREKKPGNERKYRMVL
jgi:hypothetical protein